MPSESTACERCGASFGRLHACGICKIYSHDKPMWHCQQCGICRAGSEDEYVHCEMCDGCVRRDQLRAHRCAPYAMHHQCVVCKEYLFSSRREVTQLPCGHLAVHQDCLEARPASPAQLTCPHCRPAPIHICSGGSPAAAAAGSANDNSLEKMLESLQLTDYDADSDSGSDGGRLVYESGGGSRIIPCARVEWPLELVYVGDKVTAGYYLRRFNELPLEVTPPQEDNSDGSRAVDRVAEALRTIGRALSVDRVHIGGSFGRKTTVKGRWDVDLLILVNGFEPSKTTEVEDLLRKVARELAHRFPQVEVKVRTDIQMLQLELQGVEMDVPFVRNVATYEDRDKAAAQRRVLVSPLLRFSDAEIEAMARREPDRARERAVSEALTDFVKSQHSTVNQAVRLFKAWVKCGLAERRLLTSKKLPSIALELIVLAAFQQLQMSDDSASCRRGVAGEGPTALGALREGRKQLLLIFVRSLELASRLLEPDCVVTVEAGQELGYRREQGLRFRPCWGAAGPFVIHPIDPTCNVAREPDNGRPPWDWAGLAKQAGILLTVLRHCSLRVLLHESTMAAALFRLRNGIGGK